jgi:hypothetical protein
LSCYTPVSLPLAKPASPFAVVWPAGSVGFDRANQKLLQPQFADLTITSSALVSNVDARPASGIQERRVCQ